MQTKLTQQIIVASSNPIKIEATLAAFQRSFPNTEWQIEGIAAPSGVPDQPLGDEQTLTGSLNRLNHIHQARPEADFWVGLEGGIDIRPTEIAVFGWMTIRHADLTSKARTGEFYLPQSLVKLVNEGMELGPATDLTFNETNTSKRMGTVGVLTHHQITRSKYYEHALILALIPFLNNDLYNLQ